MKIALVVRNYDRRGGISGYTAELAEDLARKHEVHVFAASWRDVRNTSILFHKVPVLTFDYLKKRKKHAINNIFEVGSFALSSFFRVKNENFDIVHVQGDYLGKMDVYTAHSCHKAWLSVFNREKHGFIERLMKSALNPLHFILLAIESHCVRKAKKVIAVSQAVKRELVDQYGIAENRIVTISNGVDIDRFSPKRKNSVRNEIRRQYGINDDEFIIIFPAHEFKRKGLAHILDAVELINNNKVRVLIVGKDSPAFFTGMYGRLKDRMIFAGEVREISDYYAASDLMVFPTAYEPFGLVILEAMAAGIPVITTSVAGAAELIKNGKNGVLIDSSSDIDKLANAILYFMTSSDDVVTIGKEARKTAENYTWQKIVEMTCKVYGETIEAKK